MPPSTSENDIKRRARRRLIGAVALTLLAVIMLPLLLEDEPPPASSLAVKMAAPPAEVADAPTPSSMPGQADDPAPAVPPQAGVTEPSASHEAIPEPAPRPEPPKPQAARPPTQREPAKPAAKPAAPGEMYVVQLAALSDSAKAHALKGQAALAGLPVYTDKVGALTRVRVGPYKSRDAAVAASAKLAENGMSGQILTQ